MSKTSIALLLASNLGILVVFAWLAIHFDKWWLVLISIIFFDSYKTKS